MRPRRTAKLVARWVRLYTRGLPAAVAERRISEIEADVHDHIAHEQARGSSDRRIALSILSRMVRGLAADASWRRQRADSRFSGRLALATGLVLLVPLVAMQFTDEVAWTLADFVVAGALLYGAGTTYRLVIRKGRSNAYRVAAAMAVAAALMLLWLMGAVGIIGVEGDPADMMYLGVLAAGAVGALIARFRPGGMARALLAMAIAQGLVTVIALIAGKHHAPSSSAFEIIGLNAFFIALFVGSAWLFRRAADSR